MAQQRLISTKDDFLKDFNSVFNNLREDFHRTGRFDDANAKLDEIIKLLTVKLFDVRNNTNFLCSKGLEKIAKEKFGDSSKIAMALQSLFAEVAQDELFFNSDGTNIFGSNPHLNIQSVDDDFARLIVRAIDELNFEKGTDLDLLNEAFGLFVRDNFRNHKEDAQYMTPIEVVDAILDIAMKDVFNDQTSRSALLSTAPESFIILDPTCGVGTFLTRAARKISELVTASKIKNKELVLKSRNENSFIGQDKVDRMVRMSRINHLFFGLNPKQIEQGNSILGTSFIDKYSGKVDLIITNPPFGAEFDFNEILGSDVNFDVLLDIKGDTSIKTISSELIMIDRSLKLLKPGGRLFIVVPDGIVSAHGVNDVYRKALSKKYILRGVVDLPAVTFAQAGTRTRCSVLYIQKPYEKNNFKQNGVFMAVAKDIGYEVKERMGSPVKIYAGSNDLATISNTYSALENLSGTRVISENPSIVIHPFETFINNKWNANFYNASRIQALEGIQNKSADFEIKSLKEIAEFCTKQRKRKPVSDSVKCISVLHINDDSSIKIDEIAKYSPICSGNECFPGEILFSKINPRIPRVAVIPELDYQLTCSSEFEIIKPFKSEHTYLLKSLLLTDLVQQQILSLTSGTSSSHNRIKSSELMNIKVPMPKNGSALEKRLLELAKSIQSEERNKYRSNNTIRTAFKKVEDLVAV